MILCRDESFPFAGSDRLAQESPDRQKGCTTTFYLTRQYTVSGQGLSKSRRNHTLYASELLGSQLPTVVQALQ